MNNRIAELEINNFKSIKHLKMDCKRINVLIGKPNVGKSNILEALSLFVTPYSNTIKFLDDYIRYEKLSNLFYDLDRKNPTTVRSNLGIASLRFHMNGINAYDLIIDSELNILNIMNQPGSGNSLNEKGKTFSNFQDNRSKNNSVNTIKPFYASMNENANINIHYNQNSQGYDTPIKKYHFKSLNQHKNHFPLFLLPPYGDNLFTILEGNRKLWDEFAEFFNQYGLDLLVDKEDEKLDIQKKEGRYVTKIPYSLAADTLQRIIFHLTAIETNTDSILLFEEPENHSFPPYIKLLAERVIENERNQFFIATHSPYLLTPFIEQCSPKDIAIFVASYENYETKIKALTDEEIQNILDTNIDLFFNIRAFEK